MGARPFFLVPLVAVVFDEPDVEPGVTRAVSLLIFSRGGVTQSESELVSFLLLLRDLTREGPVRGDSAEGDIVCKG